MQYARGRAKRFLDDLKAFVAVPSVSTDPAYREEIDRAARWIADRMRELEIDGVEVCPTGGHPVVYGEVLSAGPGVPTVLVYGHYDVQPAEPLELWTSGAYEPAVRGDYLYGRGATDMKGQVMAVLHAVEAVARTGPLPVNIKFLIEGEEEIGSPSLRSFVESNKERLRCDVALNTDTGMIAPDRPTIVYALRGLACFEIRLYGPGNDLHSGIYGGVVHNPAQVLCELIAGMHDGDGHVTLPGFYEAVRPLTAEERSELARLPMDESFYREKTGAPLLWGEAGFTPVERTGARPTLEVNGILSGYTGPGAKTVLPALAMAKISTRLVPDQDPGEVREQLMRYLEAKAPPTVRWEIVDLGGGPASLSRRDSGAAAALGRAMEQVWGKPPLFKREGGSVPAVSILQDLLGIDSLNTGFSLPDDNMHGPDERLHLPTWYRGIEMLIHFFFNLGEQGGTLFKNKG
ncbi:MAG: dipeptidase [Deltaproteobacteria bacterium]|nr:dipeptidase [Deltaproteobacteria bacterium]